MTEIVNLTPYKFMFMGPYGIPNIIVEPSGQVVSINTYVVPAGEVNGIPVTEIQLSVEGLPAPEPGKIFIVSPSIAKCVTERDDIFIPNDSIGNGNGDIIYQGLGKIRKEVLSNG